MSIYDVECRNRFRHCKSTSEIRFLLELMSFYGVDYDVDYFRRRSQQRGSEISIQYRNDVNLGCRLRCEIDILDLNMWIYKHDSYKNEKAQIQLKWILQITVSFEI